jgi:mRNA interferase MazF
LTPTRKRPPPEEGLRVRRGDVLWINCDPSVGVEPRKTRTCVVVSNDLANEFGAAVTVVPTQAFTADRAARVYMVDLRKPRSTLAEPRVANASMIMTYDRNRIVSREGRLHRDALIALDRALSVHLGLIPP